MAILEEVEENQSTSTTVAVLNPSSNKTKNRHLSVPDEIIEDILLRLPVESILRSTSVSKPWYSLITHPSFSKLQLTHSTSAHRTAFFLSVYDRSTCKRHFLSASALGGPLTLLLTVGGDLNEVIPPSHSNGLISFTSKSCPVFINPTTRKLYKLPPITPPARVQLFGLLYGFDDSTNQHKILLINTKESEFKVFDMSTRSWRNIEAEPPVGFTWDDIQGYYGGGVCFDSIVHVMLGYCNTEHPFEFLAFDFVTEKFSLFSIPEDAWPHIWNPDDVGTISNKPFIMKISGSLGVVVYDYRKSQIHIWLLQDYQKGVWVKETVMLPEPWDGLARNVCLSIDANMDDEIVFNISKVSENVVIVPVYNRKTKSFRSLEFTLDDQVFSSKKVRFNHIKYYVESMVPV